MKMVPRQNPVFESTKFVVDNADHVFLHTDVLAIFADDFNVPVHTNWMIDSFGLADLSNEERAMLCVVFNAISFSYWGEPYWQVDYRGKRYDRASWSLVAAILRSREEGQSMLNPDVLARLTRSDLARLLRGTVEIPMIEERLMILNLVGTILKKTALSALIEQAGQDALKMVEIILMIFSPSFDDRYEYKGRLVIFNKRAQALVESLHSMFKGEGLGEFKNLSELSALADYIIPNLLRSEGIISYSDQLARIIDTAYQIEKGSAYEVEIRAAVVWSIELLRQHLSSKVGREIDTASVNDGLWLKGGEIPTPFHHTRTTAY